MKPTNRKSWAGNLLMYSGLTLSPSFKVKQGQPNLKVLITHLLFVLDVCNQKSTYMNPWVVNLLMCSDLTLGPSLKFKTRTAKLNRPYNSLIIGLRCLQ